MFKADIATIKTRLLIDNDSKAELIDKSFGCTQKFSTFKLRKKIKLTLGNGKVVQKLDTACLVDIHIVDHHKHILCYIARLNVYTLMLGDGWLQMHNLSID